MTRASHRLAAFAWLIAVLVAVGYLGVRVERGLVFRTDLMALLPIDEQNPALQQATDEMTRALSGRIMMLVGDPDRDKARAAAFALEQTLSGSGLADMRSASFGTDDLKKLGALYFPYRDGLLSDADRAALLAGHADALAARAEGEIFGVGAGVDSAEIRNDPFLLMRAFFSALPVPASKLSPDGGLLSTTAGGVHWAALPGQVRGDPYSLDIQRRFGATLDPAIARLQAADPGLKVLRVGAIFFAAAGAQQAIGETSRIGIASTLGTALLVLLMFRALAPLWLTLLVIGTGIATALSASLALFGEIHVGAMLFGVSLIGVAVDYCLQYCTEIFAAPAPPRERLRRVFMGITIGMATTVVGYLTLFLAPFPGLHQIALFSAIGLLAAWITVIVWLPAIDRSTPPRHGRRLLAAAATCLAFWELPRWRIPRLGLLGLLLLAGIAGIPRWHADDDVHHMQSLYPPLVAEQQQIAAIAGADDSGQFFVVRAADDDDALKTEETLDDRLRALVGKGDLAGFESPAEFVPSAERQREDRALVQNNLDGPLLARHLARLGLPAGAAPPDPNGPVLTLAMAMSNGGPLAFLAPLILKQDKAGAMQAVALDRVTDLAAVADAGKGLAGVDFVDPAAQFSALLGKYRVRALWLLALSAALMTPLLMWRHGFRRGLWVMVPPLLAVALAPFLRALAGAAFTFFDAMALVLVLSVGVDYAVFLAEPRGDRSRVTMLAVALAALSALLSFGLLAFSGVAAVHAFGTTMLVGILLAFLLAPLVRWNGVRWHV